MNPKSIIIFCFLVANASSVFSSQTWQLLSPDGNLLFELREIKPQGMLEYQIKYRQVPVILPSQLGITGWEQDVEIENVIEKSVDTVWKPVYGERALVRDNYNQKTFISKPKGRSGQMHIIVRAYNEGIAFRYFYSGNQYLRIEAEETTFRVPDNTYCWFAPYAQAEHVRLPVYDWTDEAERPLTLQYSDGLYVSLGEAEMVNYSRTKFYVKPGEKNIIRCVMYDIVEEIAPFATPWRVVMVAQEPKDLLANNDIFLNLNEPLKIKDTEWIKPVKIMRTHVTTEAAMKMIDFAVKRKLNYIHFDTGWYGPETSKESDPRKTIAALNMPEVVSYARANNIGVWVYVNQRALTDYLDEILPLYQSWGIAGIKFGFVHVGSFRWTTWLHEAVRKCAQYNIMVNIHDEYRPTGFSRTYPNLLTQEGVRGNGEFPDGVNNTTLPFTRFLAGAADATVCYYQRRELKSHLNIPDHRLLINTAAHQMALALINYSPLQYLFWYDNPDDFQDEPELDYFDKLPTVWDDTRVIDGAIGEFISMARRKGDTWFAACITNNDARNLNFPLDFLDAEENYELTLYTDGGEAVNTRTRVAIEKKTVNNRTVLNLDMLPRGGAAMIIRKKM